MKKIIGLLVIWSFGLLVAAHAADELSSVRAQIKTTETAAKKIEVQVQKSDADVKRTQRDLVRAAERVDKLEETRDTLVKNIKSLEAKRIVLANEIAANRGNLADAAAGLVAASANPSFDTDNARDYVLTGVLMTGIADEFDRDMAAAAKQISELERVQTARTREQTQLNKTAKKYEAERSDLEKLMAMRTAQNAKLRNQQFELQQRLKNLSARAKNLSELTAGLDTGKQTGRYTGRRMRSPVSGMLLLRYGDTSARGVISDGWTIRTRPGAIVSAPADGRVEFADGFKGYNRVLIISHKGGFYSVLTGMQTLDTILGQEVLAGEPVGRMPNDKPEMYMELRSGARAVNPEQMFEEPN
ncbi:MAG: peptidoglycan DD-metalloendopeptidase family protein [Rickettsiales bacterium]|nr:peptidoglycan DD-metalloendopeptidase family protein [Rickettsiales bacterium]